MAPSYLIRNTITHTLFMRVTALLTVSITICNASAALNLYPETPDSSLKKNADFIVQVRPAGSNANWQELPVYEVQVDMDNVQRASMAQFDMDNCPVEISIHKQTPGRIDNVAIRPLSKNVAYTSDSSTIHFQLGGPQYLSIEINGDRAHNLHLFANPPESEMFDGTGDNVINWNAGTKDIFVQDATLIYFGPGVHKPKDLPNVEIQIPSNTTVYLAPGAVVKAKLVVNKAENVRIIGRGILDHPLRGIEITHSNNVLIDGITIVNPDHYSVFGGESSNITIKNLKSFSCKGWSDGIDLMCCSDVHIDNVFMRNSDDCIALYGHRWNFWGNSSNITVENSILWADVAHPINIGGHGNDHNEGDTLENYVFRNIDILEHDEDDDTYRGCMAIGCSDKNLIRNVLFEDIRVAHFQEGRLFYLKVYYNDKYNNAPGRGIQHVTFRNICYDGTGAFPSLIQGYDARKMVTDITFENILINGTAMKNINEFDQNEFIDRIRVR